MNKVKSRNVFKNEYLYEIVFLFLFFVIETFSRSEIALTILVITFGLLFFLFPKERKVKVWLWVLGTILGFVVEVGMGLVTRSQYWSYGSLFGVPLWLPFIWGFGFEAIYLLGIFLRKKLNS